MMTDEAGRTSGPDPSDETVDAEARVLQMDGTDTGLAIQFTGRKFSAYIQLDDTTFQFGKERSELFTALLDCLEWFDYLDWLDNQPTEKE
jgi:hypothetical protein